MRQRDMASDLAEMRQSLLMERNNRSDLDMKLGGGFSLESA